MRHELIVRRIAKRGEAEKPRMIVMAGEERRFRHSLRSVPADAANSHQRRRLVRSISAIHFFPREREHRLE